jgi:dynein heavy chain
LYDIDSNIGEVTEFLNDLYDRLVACQERAAEFKGYQKEFRLEVTRFDILDEVMADVKLRMLLWESVTSWSKTLDEWYNSDFHELNVDEMNLFTAKTIKNITLLEKGLPKNLIVPKLKDDVELMKNKVTKTSEETRKLRRICSSLLWRSCATPLFASATGY